MLIGFSTGSLALSDFRLGLQMVDGQPATAIELSALRERELIPLIRSLDSLHLDQFSYIALHAPSKLKEMSEGELVEALREVAARQWPIVVHPDVITNFDAWRQLEKWLCIENMDKRKPTGRTAQELQRLFSELPSATLCFDIGHAHQIDPTMCEADTILRRFGDRLQQIHLSFVNTASAHEPLNHESIVAFRRVAHLLPSDTPIILETPVRGDQIEMELEKVRFLLSKMRPSEIAVDWRETLKSVLVQFEGVASQSSGVNHLFVEVVDGERHKLSGPTWFAPFSRNVRIVDGKPQYGPWDCCVSGGLPGINPGFREPKQDERFSDDSDGVIRDRSGVVRAVAVPMKLRQGYYCGRPSEEVARFKSLANAAAIALAGSTELHKHVFSSDLTDIFRKRRGGVRYIFGEVPNAPDRFIAHGWASGVLQFESGVLIDVPISESSPDASHWLLLLHRLGWRRVQGSGLRATRAAWDANVEVELESLLQDWSHYPDDYSKRFANMSKESFYSVLGTKEAPLDVHLASVFAIKLLLAHTSPITSTPPLQQEPLTNNYSREQWKLLPLPSLRTVDRDEAKEVSQPTVGVLVATEVERDAVLKKLRPPRNKRAVLQAYSGKNTCFVGRLGVIDVVLCMSAVGSVGRDSSTIVTNELIQYWQVAGVIMAGIAFGKDATKQQIGNVLVSDRIICYESERLGVTSREDRGSQPMAGPLLLNRFRNALGWIFKSPSGQQCGFQIGPILSGEKLVDNPDVKQKLFKRYPTAIGGEMEGAGVAAAAERNRCEWIVVKAICDWGDGTKTKLHQEFAAASSVDLVEHVLNQPGALGPLTKRIDS